jgi:hypothetical protein
MRPISVASCVSFIIKVLPHLKPREQHRIVLLQVTVQQEDEMRVLAILFGVRTAVSIVAGVSAAPAQSGIQLAQAQDSGALSEAGASASQRGSAGNREGGAAASGSSPERGAGVRQSRDGSATVRSAKRTSDTTVRERAGITRTTVRGGTRWVPEMQQREAHRRQFPT